MLQLEFTKSEAANVDSIFTEAWDDVEGLGIHVSQPDSPQRYDMLVPSAVTVDNERLHRIVTIAFDAALSNILS